MWSWRYAALYAHYTCIGLVNGMLTQALMPYCLYVAHGQPNTCATVSTFVNLPWGYKLLYGMLADKPVAFFFSDAHVAEEGFRARDGGSTAHLASDRLLLASLRIV